jgi:hypothetical protein
MLYFEVRTHLFWPLCTMKPIVKYDELDVLWAKYNYVQWKCEKSNHIGYSIW